MNYMFKEAESFNQDLSNWKISVWVKHKEFWKDAKKFKKEYYPKFIDDEDGNVLDK
jgi:hypothetical protein